MPSNTAVGGLMNRWAVATLGVVPDRGWTFSRGLLTSLRLRSDRGWEGVGRLHGDTGEHAVLRTASLSPCLLNQGARGPRVWWTQWACDSSAHITTASFDTVAGTLCDLYSNATQWKRVPMASTRYRTGADQRTTNYEMWREAPQLKQHPFGL